MEPRVAVVTDSTSYLPEGLAEKYEVSVVPLQVVLGGRVGAEGVDVRPDEVTTALAGHRAGVSTSRPAPAAFAGVYEKARADGATEVVSVHISAELSGTADAARDAAGSAGIDVRVVDSRTVAMGLGFAVVAAARAALEGRSAGEVAEVAEEVAEAGQTLLYVDTLEHLRRGGRIGTAQALLGAALLVKPILCISEGRLVPLEKVRTASRGLARLAELAVERAGDRPVDVAVHHLAAPERAAALAGMLRSRIPTIHDLVVSEVGAVVGAHTGPGALGVVVAPAVLST